MFNAGKINTECNKILDLIAEWKEKTDNRNLDLGQLHGEINTIKRRANKDGANRIIVGICDQIIKSNLSDSSPELLDQIRPILNKIKELTTEQKQ